MKIRKKLILLLLSIALTPALLISTVAYITISNQITNQTTAQLSSLAIKQDQKINALLLAKQQQLTGLVSSYEFRKALDDYVAAPNPVSLLAMNDILHAAKARFLDIEVASVVAPSGEVMTSTAASTVGTKLATSEYTLNTDKQSSIALHEDSKDGYNKLYIVNQVNTGKKLIAYLAFSFSIDDIVAAVQDYSGLGTTGETVVAQEDAQHNAVSLFPLRFDTEAALHAKLNTLQLLTRNNAVHKNLTDYRGKDVFVATRTLDITGWGLATKIDKDEAQAPIAGLRNAIIAIFTASVIVITLVAVYYARFFTAPIVTLTARTRQLIQGDFKQKMAVTSNDEVGMLASAFNTMTTKLEESYQVLEQKVVERTQTLNIKLQELANAKAKDDAVLQSIGEGMIVTDSSGYVLLMNDIAAELLGTDVGAAVGRKTLTLYNLYDDANQAIPAEERPLQVALKTGKKTVASAKCIRKDGAAVTLSITATPVWQQGAIIGAIQIVRDITREREVDRMKTEFISLASHQLRTPLSAIRWFTEMLLAGDAGELTGEQKEYTKNVADSTQRMIELVDSLLNISRIESGRIIVDPRPTDLNELVSGIVKDLEAKTSVKEQTLTISVHKELPKINLDPHLIGQVYLNLLTNAIKYTPKGGEISVFVSRKNDQVISQITDTGYGIPKSEQQKMFQKFFRATNIVKVETDGTGLGMYLVKSIVESSGGKIWFESEEGKGTTFWFTIPLSGMKAKQGQVVLGS